MVKKLGLTSLFSSSNSEDGSTSIRSAAAGSLCPSSSSSMSAAASWKWPACKQPRTLSFRQQQQQHHGHHMMMSKQAYKTMNSAYFPDSADSCFSNSFASVESLSTASEASGTVVVDANEAEAEAVIRALRSDRLFFEPDASPATASSSILKKAKVKPVNDDDDDDDKETITCTDSSSRDNKQAAFDGATAMSVDSENPYRDFRASMEEMVMSHGAKDWQWLEEMLGWYLRANGKSTHGLIVGAFVDLLVALSTTASPSASTIATNCSTSSACSSFSGIAIDEIKEEEEEGDTINGDA